MVFRNTDAERRVWPSLKNSDGTTLVLGPGETAEVEVPEGFSDPYLEEVKEKKPVEKKESKSDAKPDVTEKKENS